MRIYTRNGTHIPIQGFTVLANSQAEYQTALPACLCQVLENMDILKLEK